MIFAKRLKYLVVYEYANESYSGYAPDLRGCTSIGNTLDTMRKNMLTAIRDYLAPLAAEGSNIPRPYVTVVQFPRPAERPDIKHWVVEWIEV
jgi:predicted RNase H-like HicB family nuclease